MSTISTRDKILRAATELIMQTDFDNMCVADITAAAGVAKGSFYTYFKRKEDVVFEICREPFRVIAERFMADTKTDIITKLARYFDDFMREVQRYGINICREWVRNVIAPAAAPDNMDAKKWEYDTKMLRRILASSVAAGELKDDAPVDLITHLMISQLYGMMTCWCMSDARFNPRTWTRKFSEFQLNAILKPYLTNKPRGDKK